MVIGISTGKERDDKLLKNQLDKLKIVSIITAPFTSSFRGIIKLYREVSIFYMKGIKLHFKSIIFWKILRKKIIVYWTGNEVLYGLKHPYIAKFISYFIDINLVVTDKQKDTLKDININAEKIPFISYYPKYSLEGLPKKFLILIGLSKENNINRHEVDLIKKIVKEIPDVMIYIVGRELKELNNLPNIAYKEETEDMESIYREASVILDISTFKDNLDIVINGLGKGRQVITTFPFPFSYYAFNDNEIINTLLKFKKEHSLNIAGSNFVNEEFNKYLVLEKNIEFFKKITSASNM